jgi:hypothetical protein
MPDELGELTLSERLRLERLAAAQLRELSWEDLFELRWLVGKALGAGHGVRRSGLSLAQRVWLRGLRQEARAEESRRYGTERRHAAGEALVRSSRRRPTRDTRISAAVRTGARARPRERRARSGGTVRRARSPGRARSASRLADDEAEPELAAGEAGAPLCPRCGTRAVRGVPGLAPGSWSCRVCVFDVWARDVLVQYERLHAELDRILREAA